MSNLADFIRWARDEVIARPEVSQYELVSIVDNGVPQRVMDFSIDHIAKEIHLISAEENADYDDDYDPPDDEPGAEEG